jgi:hypothetical protein
MEREGPAIVFGSLGLNIEPDCGRKMIVMINMNEIDHEQYGDVNQPRSKAQSRQIATNSMARLTKPFRRFRRNVWPNQTHFSSM